MKVFGIATALLLFAPGLSAEFHETQLNQGPIQRAGVWEYRQDGAGDLWLGYYDHNQVLHVRSPDGSDRLIPPASDRPGPEAAGPKSPSQSGLSLAARSQGVDLLWREKFPIKKFFLLNSLQPEQSPLAIGEGTEPLTRLKAEFFSDRLHLLWYGERSDPVLKQNNFVYYQSLGPQPGEVSAVERLFPGIYPVWAKDAAGNIMAFSWIEDDQGSRIVARFKGGAESEFRPAVKLAEVESLSHIFRGWQSQGRWFALWATSRNGLQSLEGALSDDQGASWRPLTLTGLDNRVVNSLNVTLDDEGRIFLALSGTDLSTPGAKQDIRIFRSTDRGETWELQRLRPESVATRYRALNPAITLGPNPGEVLVVWEDWRSFRGQLFASQSRDYGATWEMDNLPLPQPVGVNRGLPDAFSSLFVKDGVYHVITQQAVDDGLGAYHLIDVAFSRPDLIALKSPATTAPMQGEAANQAPAPVTNADAGAQGVGEVKEGPVSGADPKEEALRKRATSYWQAMVTQDFFTTYGMHDPFFRARVSQFSYMTKMGRISYKNPVVEAIEIEANYARVTVRFTATVPPFRARTGEIISRPDKEILLTEVWLWLDGDWYREYYSEAEDVRFTRY